MARVLIDASLERNRVQVAKALASVAQGFLGACRSVRCVVDEDRTLFTKDIGVLLQNIDVEHPIGQLICSVCESHHKKYGCSTKSLLAMIGWWVEEAGFLLNQGIPVADIIHLMHTSLDKCIDQLHKIIIDTTEYVNNVFFTEAADTCDKCSVQSYQQNKQVLCSRASLHSFHEINLLVGVNPNQKVVVNDSVTSHSSVDTETETDDTCWGIREKKTSSCEVLLEMADTEQKLNDTSLYLDAKDSKICVKKELWQNPEYNDRTLNSRVDNSDEEFDACFSYFEEDRRKLPERFDLHSRQDQGCFGTFMGNTDMCKVFQDCISNTNSESEFIKTLSAKLENTCLVTQEFQTCSDTSAKNINAGYLGSSLNKNSCDSDFASLKLLELKPVCTDFSKGESHSSYCEDSVAEGLQTVVEISQVKGTVSGCEMLPNSDCFAQDDDCSHKSRGKESVSLPNRFSAESLELYLNSKLTDFQAKHSVKALTFSRHFKTLDTDSSLEADVWNRQSSKEADNCAKREDCSSSNEALDGNDEKEEMNIVLNSQECTNALSLNYSEHTQGSFTCVGIHSCAKPSEPCTLSRDICYGKNFLKREINDQHLPCEDISTLDLPGSMTRLGFSNVPWQRDDAEKEEMYFFQYGEIPLEYLHTDEQIQGNEERTYKSLSALKYSRVCSLVRGLCRNLDETADFLMKALWEQNQKGRLHNRFLRFDVTRLHCCCIIGPGAERSHLVQGVVLPVSPSQMALVCGAMEREHNILLVNGCVTEQFRHVGYKSPVVSQSIYSEQEYKDKGNSKSCWHITVFDILIKLDVTIVVSTGKVDSTLCDLLEEKEIAALDNIPFSALQALASSVNAEPVIYIIDASQENLVKNIVVEPWVEDWMCKSATSQLLLTVRARKTQTMILCHPTQAAADVMMQEFWMCAHRLENSLKTCKVLPGEGITELFCINFLNSLRDSVKATSSDCSLEMLLHADILQGLSCGFQKYIQAVEKNRAKPTFSEMLTHCEKSPSAGSEGHTHAVLDDYCSKVAGWRTALQITSLILQTDMHIVTGLNKDCAMVDGWML